jgi:hypothetical protein
MKRICLLAICLLLTPALVFAAESKKARKAAAETPAIAAVPTGDYEGKWKGQNGASGELKFKLKQEASVWSADVSFTFEETPIPTKATSLKVEGAKFEMVIEWVIQGTPGHSRLTGEWKDGSLKGAYDSQPEEAASRGTWEVRRA